MAARGGDGPAHRSGDGLPSLMDAGQRVLEKGEQRWIDPEQATRRLQRGHAVFALVSSSN